MSTESPSTTDRLAEIEARAENRVPGHWHAVSIEFRGQTSHSVKSNVGSVLAHTGYGPVGGSSHANAEFMANAPADIEFLLEENARLRARLDTAEGQLATARDLHAKGIWTVHSENLMWDEEGCVHCRIEWPCPTAEALGDNGSGVSR